MTLTVVTADIPVLSSGGTFQVHPNATSFSLLLAQEPGGNFSLAQSIGGTLQTSGSGGGGGGGGSNAAASAINASAPNFGDYLAFSNAGGTLVGVSPSSPLPVSLSSGTLAVTGTFYQATQPVSIATLPALATGANVIGAVTQSGTWNVSIAGTPTVALSTGSTLAVTAASLPLPTGAATASGVGSIVTALGTPFQAGGSIGNTAFGATQSGTWNVGVTGSVATTEPDVRGTLTVNSATSNATATISLSNGVSTVGFTVSGLTASTATLTLEGSNDGGTTWSAINYVSAGTGVLGSTLTADGQFSAAAAGRTGIRLRVSTVGTGTVTIVTSASIGTRDVAMSAPIPPGANAIGSVGTVGTVGADYSVNKPTIPTVGSSFAGTGPYANYVLLTTIPALSTRNNVDIENTSGAQIVIVRDDGTAASGASPANASVFALTGGNTSGAQGGSWASKTFKGRLQIYAASSTAFVTVMVD